MLGVRGLNHIRVSRRDILEDDRNNSNIMTEEMSA